jgi:hypothetical protein
MHTHTYIHIFTHTYIYIHTHTYTHIYTCSHTRSGERQSVEQDTPEYINTLRGMEAANIYQEAVAARVKAALDDAGRKNPEKKE